MNCKMKVIEAIKGIFSKNEKPKITVEYGENDKESQRQELMVYKDGEYSHTVNLMYFTEEQFKEMKKIEEKMYNERKND